MIVGLSRKAQIWTIDFALSLTLFIVTMLVAYSIITNTIDDTSYDEVVAQADDVATLLVSEGYPSNWTNNTMIRAGLISDGVLSLRKADSLATLSQNEIRKGLRATDYIYAYFVNSSGNITTVTSTCGFGDLTVGYTENNGTRDATALVAVPEPVSNGLNATLHTGDGAFADFLKSDVIILEGNLTLASTQSPEKMKIQMEDISERGITIVIIGDPGFSFAGVDTVSVMTEKFHVQGNAGSELDFTTNEILNISEIGPVAVPAITQPAGHEIGDYRTIALSDGGDIVIATWIYNDARIWFISTSDGERQNGQPLNTSLRNTIDEKMITVPMPDCGDVVIPSSATQIVHQDRTVPFHDEMLVLKTVVWRDR